MDEERQETSRRLDPASEGQGGPTLEAGATSSSSPVQPAMAEDSSSPAQPAMAEDPSSPAQLARTGGSAGRPLNAMTPEELEALVRRLGQPAFRARQLFHFFHSEEKWDLAESSNLPKALQADLQAYPINRAEVAQTLDSADGSRKYLFRLHDGAIIESVYMPYADRTSLCLSSQVGCRMGCRFCASTKASFVRNLGAEEMLDQVYMVEKTEVTRLTNLVIMGIGEPLDNYQELCRFIRLVGHPDGRNLSHRAITLSTCGLVPRIYDLAESGLGVNLALSLHATNDAQRAQIMPIARAYKLDEVLKACSAYFDQTGRRVSFEYMLIQGFNDQEKDLDWMGKKLANKAFHVNLIPLNQIREFDRQGDTLEEVRAFERGLRQRGVQVTIRKRRGADIDAACGQLRILYQEKSGNQKG